MPKSQKSEAAKYSSTTLAVIIILAISIGAFMYNLITKDSTEVNSTQVNGINMVITEDGISPAKDIEPATPPKTNVVPTTPPPAIPEIPAEVME